MIEVVFIGHQEAMSLNFWRLVAIRLFTLDFMGRRARLWFCPKRKNRPRRE